MTWRHRLVRILDCFEWGDSEYLRHEWRWRYPWVFWLTIYEPRCRRGWRKFMPYRLRTAWANVFIDMLVRTCPGCEGRFTFGELIGRDGSLDRYPSGTTWHADCRNKAVRKPNLGQ